MIKNTIIFCFQMLFLYSFGKMSRFSDISISDKIVRTIFFLIDSLGGQRRNVSDNKIRRHLNRRRKKKFWQKKNY
jgi:hypothetical protein